MYNVHCMIYIVYCTVGNDWCAVSDSRAKHVSRLPRRIFSKKCLNFTFRRFYVYLRNDVLPEYPLNVYCYLFTGFTLIEANLNLVDWIISYMGITESSYLLDIACGRGKYTVEIAKRTGNQV